MSDLRTAAEPASIAVNQGPPEARPLPGDRDRRVTIIKPAAGFPRLDLRELWHYRELGLTFVWRDLKVRYKQTFVGVGWAIIQPFMSMVVFTVIFGQFADFPPPACPYPIFIFSGLLPWTYFASALPEQHELVGSTELVTKVYFPRLLVPLAAVVAPRSTFCSRCVVLVGVMVYYGLPVRTVTVSPAAGLPAARARRSRSAVGLWLSAVNVRYRDVPYVIPFLSRSGCSSTPVIYSDKPVPTRWQWLYALNPMTGVITGSAGHLCSPPPTSAQVAICAGVARSCSSSAAFCSSGARSRASRT